MIKNIRLIRSLLQLTLHFAHAGETRNILAYGLKAWVSCKSISVYVCGLTADCLNLLRAYRNEVIHRHCSCTILRAGAAFSCKPHGDVIRILDWGCGVYYKVAVTPRMVTCTRSLETNGIRVLCRSCLRHAVKLIQSCFMVKAQIRCKHTAARSANRELAYQKKLPRFLRCSYQQHCSTRLSTYRTAHNWA